MTKATALQLLADLVGDDPDYLPALEALSPKARKPTATRAQLACKEILRNLRRPDGFGDPSAATIDARYLDTFGEHGTQERERQEARLRTLDDGPSPEAFGKPPAVAWVKRAAMDWNDDERRRAADRAVYDAWLVSPQGKAFEAAQAAHEARRAQFAYVPPKTRKDDERQTFALAILARTGGTVETIPAALAA